MNETDKKIKIPAYLRELYPHHFSRNLAFLSGIPPLAFLTTFGFFKKLSLKVSELLKIDDSVLQTGVVAGGFEDIIFASLGKKGSYTVCDISPIKLNICKEQLFSSEGIVFLHHDASQPFSLKYDKIICWFLLHEVPDTVKKEIVSNALNALTPGGKAVFIDYHQPCPKHLIGFFIKIFNRLKEPFAESLFDKDLKYFSQNPSSYIWETDLFFGDLYQITTAEKKKNAV